MRVLLADADEFAELVQVFLWDCGHEAEVVRDGVECVTVLREFLPDVIVVDGNLQWGGSDGVVAWLKEHPHFAGTPVIITAEPAAGETVAPSDSPTVGLLSKPYRLGQVLDQITAAARFVPADPPPLAAEEAEVPTYFVQTCPHCARWLSISIQQLGKLTKCYYCHAFFLAVQGFEESFGSIGRRGSPLKPAGTSPESARTTSSYRPGCN